MQSKIEPRKPNRLKDESSPYLKQHQYNYVDWYPWGDEAFQKAKNEDKIIFLSIGYSTCHWCHVMAHESFEDKSTSEYLNKNFVSIKVDREERPDLDNIYQHVIQLTGRSGGWPLSIFMTPDKKPFFAGTYFPNKPKYGMIDFKSLLKRIVNAYKKDNKGVIESANNIISAMEKLANPEEDISGLQDSLENAISLKFNEDFVHDISMKFEDLFDKKYGGFGSAPKFPNYTALLFLIRQVAEYEQSDPTKYQKLKELIQLTLDKMSDGGIYDHIGGGFARYSVDNYWLIPHFEKMLYDNAQALILYSEAYKLFKTQRYKEIVSEIIEWLMRDLFFSSKNEAGVIFNGFYSAMDADSDGSEGKYYLWDRKELDKILPEEHRDLFYEAYGVTEEGNFEKGKTNLSRIKSDEELLHSSQFSDLSIQNIKERLQEMRKLLLIERSKRNSPGIDTKFLTSWNALLIRGLYNAFEILGDPEIRSTAHSLTNFVRYNLLDEENGLLYSVYDVESHKKKNIGTLDVYAYYIQALFEEYKNYGDRDILYLIESLNASVKEQFWDMDKHAYFYSSHLSKDTMVRMKSGTDMPLPNGNSVMAENLMQLHYYTGVNEFYEMAENIFEYFYYKIKRYPTAFGGLLLASQWFIQGSTDVAVIIPKNFKLSKDFDYNFDEKSSSNSDLEVGVIHKDIIEKIRKFFIPRLHLIVSSEIESTPPVFRDKNVVDDSISYFVCHKFDCLPPTTKSSDFWNNVKDLFVSF